MVKVKSSNNIIDIILYKPRAVKEIWRGIIEMGGIGIAFEENYRGFSLGISYDAKAPRYDKNISTKKNDNAFEKKSLNIYIIDLKESYVSFEGRPYKTSRGVLLSVKEYMSKRAIESQESYEENKKTELSRDLVRRAIVKSGLGKQPYGRHSDSGSYYKLSIPDGDVLMCGNYSHLDIRIPFDIEKSNKVMKAYKRFVDSLEKIKES